MWEGTAVVAVGAEARELADGLVKAQGRDSACYFDIRFGSNHYRNPDPAFVPWERRLFWDYRGVRHPDQLTAIPGAWDWFGHDANTYYFHKFLTADSHGQGPLVPAIRPLARLAYILGYEATRQLVANFIAAHPEPPRTVVLACSLADTAGSGTCIDLAYLLRRVLQDAQSDARIVGLLSTSRREAENLARMGVADAVVNQHVFAQEHHYFTNARQYSPDFLSEPAAPIIRPPFDGVMVLDDLRQALTEEATVAEPDGSLQYEGKRIDRLEDVLPPLSLAGNVSEMIQHRLKLVRVFGAQVYASA